MDWWAVCIPRASCLILAPHSSFNSAVKSKTVKLSDIWWEYMYVWLSHRTDTACTEPERQRTYNVSIEVRSLNHFCNGKAISVIYSECVLVAFGIRNAMCMCHIVICGLSASIVFSHVITEQARFSTRSVRKQNVCLDLLYNFVLNSTRYKENWATYVQNTYWYSYKILVILVRF
jgi:hypothetical protein